MQTESAVRFTKVRKFLQISQEQMGKILSLGLTTVFRYENTEPLLKEEHRKKLFSLGVNPAYIDNNSGDILLPGYTVVKVLENVERELTHA